MTAHRSTTRYVNEFIKSLIICLAIYRIHAQIKNTKYGGVTSRRHDPDALDNWVPGIDVLTELDAYATPPPLLPNQTVSVPNSWVFLVDNKKSYYVGDTIKVRIILYDEVWRKRCRGRDSVRVRMFEDSKGAYINGFVNDHGNGKFTAFLEARWAGRPEVNVDLMYTREEIAYMYRLRREFSALRMISAFFENDVASEVTFCHPVAEKLDRTWHVCDFTERNGGEPWFCQRPRNPELDCSHFTDLTRTYTSMRSRRQTKVEIGPSYYDPHAGSLNNRVKTKLAGPFILDVEPEDNRRRRRRDDDDDHHDDDDHDHDKHDLPKCSEYDRASLWRQRTPTGYFLNNTWHVPHCWGRTDFSDYTCLRDKVFYYYGDSTMKQWYEHMKYRFNCKKLSGLDYKEMRCENSAINLKMRYMRHNLPGNVILDGMDTRRVEDVGSVPGGVAEIFLLHIYSHYSYYHHNVYRARVRRLRDSVSRILATRPAATVIIKGPSTLSKRKDFGIVDYFAKVYRQALYEEFADLHDRVLFLENADMTSSRAEPNIHVPEDLVRQMVNHMLMYVCDT